MGTLNTLNDGCIDASPAVVTGAACSCPMGSFPTSAAPSPAPGGGARGGLHWPAAHLAHHDRLAARHASRVDTQRDAPLRGRRPLGAHVPECLVPHRALGYERGELHHRDLGVWGAWAGGDRRREQQREQQREREPRAAGLASHRFSWVLLVSEAGASSRKNSSCRSSSARALRCSTIVASRCDGSRSGSNASARSSRRRNSARSCWSTDTLCASVT